MKKIDIHSLTIGLFWIGVLLVLIFGLPNFGLKKKKIEYVPELHVYDIPSQTGAMSLANSYTLDGKIVSIMTDCRDFISPEQIPRSFTIHCNPKSKLPFIPKYPGYNILGIDASYKNDGIDFKAARPYFLKEGANFYGTQSPGTSPDRGVLRINSDYLFPDQRVFYIFYNDKKFSSQYTRDQIVKNLTGMFPYLDDIRLHTLTEYRREREKKLQSEIGKLFYYIGDCQEQVHGGCSTSLPTNGVYKYFSDEMVDENIDILFVIPAIMDRTKVLQGLYKSDENDE